MASVVVYPIPPMFFGVVHGWFATFSLSFHAVLYPWRQYLSSLSKSRREAYAMVLSLSIESYRQLSLQRPPPPVWVPEGGHELFL